MIIEFYLELINYSSKQRGTSESGSCHSKGWSSAGHGPKKEVKIIFVWTLVYSQVTVLLEKVVSDYWGPVTASVAGILASALATIILWVIFFKLQLRNNEDRHRHR